MISNILLVVFIIAIFLNAYALFRHWQAMRAFTVLMSNLEATQRQFNALLKNTQARP